MKTTTLRVGMKLYHGTDARKLFRIPAGPAWFSQSREVADYFKDWHAQGGKPRILVFEVIAAPRLLAIHSHTDLVDLEDELGVDVTSEPDSVVNVGCEGWNVIGNYAPSLPGQEPGDDIMLVMPERWLRRVR